MTQEDYVSFEVAKLLKEKGYNKKCNAVWETGVCRECSPKLKITLGAYDEKDLMHNIDWSEQYEYLAPSLWNAQKWLREKHNISVEIYARENDWKFEICRTEGILIMDCACMSCTTMNNKGAFDTYEKALNEGIKEALKMI